MKIAVIGFNTEGQASYEYFRAQGHQITICDQNASLAIPEGVEAQLGLRYLDHLDKFDLIVRTPGLPPQHILAANPTVENKITSGTNEFLRAVTTKNIIGVTGTKGKGTTSTLIAKILEAAGKKVWLGGNIGVPVLGFIHDIKPDDWVVLELSSFQLIDLRYSPRIGVCLMIVPEHLNWHTDFNEYADAKQNLFAHQTPEDTAIYFNDNETSKALAAISPGKKIPYYTSPGAYVEGGFIKIENQPICQTNELKLPGEHNWQNVCAAITAVWQVTHNTEAIRSVLTTFAGLPFRLEFIREFNGVRYYNDSFGTTPETAMVALEAIREPKVVILGGSDKGASYEALAQTVVNTNVRAVVTIGDIAPKITAALRTAGYTAIYDGGKDMLTIVNTARQLAQSGDAVLLSTGAASFGMFKDYKDRGNQFTEVVRALA